MTARLEKAVREMSAEALRDLEEIAESLARRHPNLAVAQSADPSA